MALPPLGEAPPVTGQRLLGTVELASDDRHWHVEFHGSRTPDSDSLPSFLLALLFLASNGTAYHTGAFNLARRRPSALWASPPAGETLPPIVTDPSTTSIGEKSSLRSATRCECDNHGRISSTLVVSVSTSALLPSLLFSNSSSLRASQ